MIRIIGFSRMGLPAALACVLLAACSSVPEPVISDVSNYQAPARERLLAVGGHVRIAVFGARGLSGDYRIGESGTLVLKGYGTIRAAGLTTRALEEKIAALMARKGIIDARVSVLAEDG